MENKKKIKASQTEQKEFEHIIQVVNELPLVAQREIVDKDNGIIYDLITTEEALTNLLNQ